MATGRDWFLLRFFESHRGYDYMPAMIDSMPLEYHQEIGNFDNEVHFDMLWNKTWEQQHWQYDNWFAAQNLDLEQIRQGHGFVAFSELCEVIHLAVKDTQQQNLGLLLGSSEGQISIGILGFAMQACKTVAEALETALHYHPISGSVLDLTVNLSVQPTFIQIKMRLYMVLVISLGVTPIPVVVNLPINYKIWGFKKTIPFLFFYPISLRWSKRILQSLWLHAETKVLLVDPEFAALAKEAVALIAQQIYIIDVADEEYENNDATARIGQIEYEDWLKSGDADFEWHLPQDEWDAISLNYTSGTTGNPKGVVYHHRGAYINAASNIIACANGGTNICLRKIDPELVYQLIDQYKVDYFCGAPIVLSMLINTPKEQQIKFEHHVEVMVAGAAPPAAIIEGMHHIGWSDLSIQEQAQLHSRQGVPYPLQDGMRVLDAETMQPVPNDGKTMGEIMFRGNIVMKGYLKNTKATEEAFKGGWFHTGDLAWLRNPIHVGKKFLVPL
ncbi:unnamed protein product [Oppiella nova]|uniref:AMP-dependent synthetase/ligase domain-containing protein n=1 Tax=Oppiella nova TaxID=334625 RepID=A0A7R9L6X3_9ACAR|nr:unnamed protein product [Oppiella nova]CAG2155807.1 unnamed protein product [Oppiella nova]